MVHHAPIVSMVRRLGSYLPHSLELILLPDIYEAKKKKKKLVVHIFLVFFILN